MIVSATAVALWLVSFALVLFLTRHRVLKPGRATDTLRAESPAVVALLVNQWQSAPDLAEATILDLAARRFVEFRLTGHRVAVHIGPDYPTGLTPYEQKVFDRLRDGVVGVAIPTDKLDFGDLSKVALQEARDAGLSQLRFDRRTLVWLASGALAAALAVGGSIFWGTGNASAIVAGFLVLLALGGLAAAGQRMQHSAAGVEAAQHWLGVRAFMRSHTSFAEQPPTTIDKWVRYMAYGSALGVTHGARLEIGGGERDLRWSNQVGGWRRVRVDYPRGWDRYGRSMPDLLRQAGLRLVAGALLLLFWRVPPLLITTVGLLLGLYLVLRALYLLVRTLLDLAMTQTVRGEVLWRETWRPSRFSPKRELYVWRVPRVHYLAVDDGRSEQLTAWALPLPSSIAPGSIVRFKAYPWSRRIEDINLIE